jgi:hypothetical protein
MRTIEERSGSETCAARRRSAGTQKACARAEFEDARAVKEVGLRRQRTRKEPQQVKPAVPNARADRGSCTTVCARAHACMQQARANQNAPEEMQTRVQIHLGG